MLYIFCLLRQTSSFLVTCVFLTSFIFIFVNKKYVTVLMMLPGLGSETSTEIKIHRRTLLQIKIKDTAAFWIHIMYRAEE